MEASALQVVVLLGLAVWVLTLIARRLHVAAPIVLLLGGVPLAFVPWLAHVRLDPGLVLFLFLPALLYAESLDTSLREIRANFRVIMLSAIGLVVATAAVVAAVGHALGLSWPVAWILGAVLAPTDATAVAAVAGRMPRRSLTTLRAESLINDGTALVILAIAIEAATGHAPIGPVGVAGQFLLSYAGGAAAGLLVGWLSLQARRRVHDVLLANTVSVLTPFISFLLAEQIHASGVVAVVVAGLLITQAGSLVITAQDRIRARAFWQISTFLLNGTLFVLVGIELRGAVAGLTSYTVPAAVRDALIVGLAVIGTRVAWINTTPYVIRAVDRRPQQRLRRIGFRQRQPGAWAGFRGAVSLAAALSVPDAVRGRDLIVVVAFGVILMTLLLQGLTLPALLRWAHYPADGEEREMALAERQAVDAAMRLLPEAAARLSVDAEITRLVRAELDERHAELSGPDPTASPNGSASNGSSSNGSASDDSTSDGSEPDGSTSEGSTSDGSTPSSSVANGSAPDGSASNSSAPDGSASNSSAPDGSASNSSAPDGSASNSSALVGSAPSGSASNGPTPNGSASNGSASGDRSRREQYRSLHRALVAEKRATVVRLRNERKIDDIVLRRVEAILDAEELRLGTPTDTPET
jgi:Na+/H+ antiporter